MIKYSIVINQSDNNCNRVIESTPLTGSRLSSYFTVEKPVYVGTFVECVFFINQKQPSGLNLSLK